MTKEVSPIRTVYQSRIPGDDLVLSGLLGLRPSTTSHLDIRPLVPSTWDHYLVENVPYHGHQVTVLTSRYDPSLPQRELRDGVEIIRPRVWLRVSKGVLMPGMIVWAWKIAHQA